jgi:hypothetical protein
MMRGAHIYTKWHTCSLDLNIVFLFFQACASFLFASVTVFMCDIAQLFVVLVRGRAVVLI